MIYDKPWSASTLNMAAECRAAFVATKLLGIADPPGPAMYRGIAFEEAAMAFLRDNDLPVEEMIGIAVAKYDAKTALTPGPAADAERAALADMCRVAHEGLRGYPVPDAHKGGRQERINITLDGVKRPIIGFLDATWSDHGLVVDFKSTKRAPANNEISAAHARQGAIYARAHPNWEMRFIYVTPKKIIQLTQHDVAGPLEQARRIAMSLEKFLSISNDPLELASLVTPNTGSFYWRSDPMRKAAKEIWGF